MKPGFAAAVAFVLFAPTVVAASPSPWPRGLAFRYEDAPSGGYALDHEFALTPAPGSEIPWSQAGYGVPIAWELPGGAPVETGRSPAWTSAGMVARFAEPDGRWTEVEIRDDVALVIRTDSGIVNEYGTAEAPRNFSAADLSRCVARVEGRCARFANDTRFETLGFHTTQIGEHALTVTITDVDGASSAYTTTFRVVPRAPSAPERLLAVPAGPRAVELDWQPPADDGGAPVRYYVVHRAVAGGAPQVVAYTVATSFRDDRVPHAAWTSYTVTAVNSVGEGPRSEAAPAIGLDPFDLEVHGAGPDLFL